MVSTARTVRDALVPNRPATPGTGAGWRPFQASSEGGGDDRGRAPPAADQPVVFFSVSVMMMMMRQDTRRGQVLLGSRGVSFVRGRGGRLVLVLVLVLLQLAEFDRAISIGLGAFVSFYKMVQTLNLGFRHIFSGKARKARPPPCLPVESQGMMLLCSLSCWNPVMLHEALLFPSLPISNRCGAVLCPLFASLHPQPTATASVTPRIPACIPVKSTVGTIPDNMPVHAVIPC